MTNQTSGKELVSAGHAFAKAISMDTPLIVIAKMVSDLSTRLDCAIARGNALQQERDALAAENAVLKSIVEPVANLSQYGDIVAEMSEALRPHEVDGFVSLFSMARHIETPATEAYLNSVRADAVASFAHQQRVIADATPEHGCQRHRRFAAGLAEDFASQLRAPKGDSDE